MQAGWTQIPAQVREADDRLVAELAIVENLHRKDLNPIEKALSFKRYLEEHGCSQEDLARPSEDRPLDHRQPDAAVGIAGSGAWTRFAKATSRQVMPARCCLSGTKRSRSSCASAFGKRV